LVFLNTNPSRTDRIHATFYYRTIEACKKLGFLFKIPTEQQEISKSQEVVSEPQIALKNKAWDDEKAQHT